MVRGDVTADVPDMDEHIEPLALAFQEFEKVCWREALGWILHGLIDFSCRKRAALPARMPMISIL